MEYLLIITIFFCIVLLIYLCYLNIDKKRKLIIFINDVWVDELLPINFLQNRGDIYILSSKIMNYKDYYEDIIKCYLRKNEYIFFRTTGSSKESIFSDKVIVTEVIKSNELNIDDYIIILIDNVYYLRKVYKLSDNILYYEYKNSISEYTIGQIALKVKFMFNKNLLVNYEK